jgi:CheY-like chemotaxis protein/anti-sigma regulatory factor (Ser/Thr protein kinase)
MQRHQLTVTVESPQEDGLKLPEEQALLLFQSVRELLINVAKHSGTHKATVSLAQRDGALRLEVRDQGKGFDIGAKDGSANGSHFGLFSIRERMQALGGSFDLESTPEKGTRATLVLPLDDNATTGSQSKIVNSESSGPNIEHHPPSRSRRSAHLEPTTQTSRKQPIRILLVDDHAMVRQGLRSLLDSYTDIEVVGEASNGEEALACVATLQPAIVVMDINMPNMNGIEATTIIRDGHPEITVIGLSVQAGGEMQQAMLKAGAAVLLTKEGAVDQLYQTIQAVQKAIYT